MHHIIYCSTQSAIKNRFQAMERQRVKLTHKLKKNHGNTSSRKYLLNLVYVARSQITGEQLGE